MTGAHPMRLHRQIASTLEAVEGLSGEVRAFLRDLGLHRLAFPVELVVRECLNNAVVHGSAGLPFRRVSFDLNHGSRWLVLRVADEGPGVPAAVRRRLTVADDTLPSGRGLPLVRGYADRVRFNRRGNAITVWFHVHRSNPNPLHATLHA